MRRARLSPVAYRRITLLAALALAFIMVTGAAVRLTDSGLGCPQWPNCEEGSLAPVSASSTHAMVEFVNRMVTGVVAALVIVAVLGSLRRQPRRRDLTWLSVGLVVGVIAQIVLGGAVVLFDLAPQLVIGHFVLSLVLLANAVVLHERAGRPDGVVYRTPAGRIPDLVRLVLPLAVVVVLTGTVVTGAGPHGGDAYAERLPFAVATVARLHGAAVWCFLAIVVLLAWQVRLDATARLRGAVTTLLAVSVAQAAVGYTQYFTGVPALLVGVHVAGAAAVWAAAVHLQLAVEHPVNRPEDRSDRSAGPALVRR